MGTYDTFVYNCPNCKKDTNSQTKLGECEMHALTIGCEFPRDGKILMKNSCEHCKKKNVVVIEDAIIMRFGKKEEAIYKEVRWGSVEILKKKEDKNGKRTNKKSS